MLFMDSNSIETSMSERAEKPQVRNDTESQPRDLFLWTSDKAIVEMRGRREFIDLSSIDGTQLQTDNCACLCRKGNWRVTTHNLLCVDCWDATKWKKERKLFVVNVPKHENDEWQPEIERYDTTHMLLIFQTSKTHFSNASSFIFLSESSLVLNLLLFSLLGKVF